MNRILSTCFETVIAAVALIPLFCYLNKVRFHHKKRTAVYVVLGLYLCAVYAVVGLPDIAYIRFDPHINLEPFAYMFSDWENSILNVILFLPLGFLLPCLWLTFKSFWRTAGFGFLTSLTIEVLQIFTFRATDVNDLITNTFGTVLGFLTARIVLKLVPKIQPGEANKDLAVICTSVFAVMFIIHPFLALIVGR